MISNYIIMQNRIEDCQPNCKVIDIVVEHDQRYASQYS